MVSGTWATTFVVSALVATASAATSVVQSTGNWKYAGCYTDSSSNRALRGKQTSNNAMTIELCAKTCAGYTWFGTEYSTQCFCGNKVEAGSVFTSSGCTMACRGNRDQLCGGANRLQMYKLNVAPSTSSAKTTPKSSAKSTVRSTTTILSTTVRATTTTITVTSTRATSTPSASAKSVSKTSSAPATSATLVSATASTPSKRAVVVHYMVGGISADWAKTDVLQAQAMGVDAFALNVVTTTADWSNNAIKLLFDAAGAAGFKLFFSFDMTHFNDPSEFIGLLQQYYNHPAYYKPTGANYVSTFYGGTKSFGYSTANAGWQAKLKDAAKSKGINTYFVPAFDDAPVDPANFFTTFPVADGAFAWEQSWPWPSQGIANVSSTRDAAYLTAARKASKTYMMGIAPIQFKHMGSGANYIRRGGLNFALRIPQILSLGPDVVQIQSWNDAGESHYIGNVWSWALSGTNIGSYTDGYDHSAWQILLKPFVKAFKAGVTSVTGVVPTSGNAQGVFWHSTLMNTASCNGDPIGVPQNRNLMENKIEVAVMLASGVSGKINVFSGGRQIASYSAVAGLNMFEVPGMVPGTVRVEVRTNTGALMLSGSGSKQVLADSSNCNYNPQVVALA